MAISTRTRNNAAMLPSLSKTLITHTAFCDRCYEHQGKVTRCKEQHMVHPLSTHWHKIAMAKLTRAALGAVEPLGRHQYLKHELHAIGPSIKLSKYSTLTR